MARTTMDISISGYTEELDSRIRQVLIGAHYREIEYYREMVWKKGTGMMTAMHYIKVEYPDYQTVRLSGWVQIGVGSVGGKERDLSGITGIIPKKSVQGTMNAIQAAILQFDQENPAQYGYVAPEAEANSTEDNHIYDVEYTDVEQEAFPPEQPVPTMEETAVYDAPYVDAELQAFPPEQPVPVLEEAAEAPAEQTASPAPQQETGFVMVMDALPSAEEQEPIAEPTVEEPTAAQMEQPAEQEASVQPEPSAAEPEQTTEANPFQRAIRPCSDNFNGDRKYLLWLCGTSLAGELPQGQSEYFAVDTRTEQPYYVISYRSSLPTQNRYEVKEPVSWEELDRYCDVSRRECLGITGTSWKEAVCSVQQDAMHMTVLWRKNDQCLEEASIFRKNDSFIFAHSEKGGLHDPTAKGTRSALTARQYRSETTFRIAVQSKISKEYVVQLLWDFLKENLQSQPITENNDAEEQRYQAEQAFQRGGLDREQAYGQQNLQPDGTPMEETAATPEPAAQEPEQPMQQSAPEPAVQTPPPAVPEERPLPAPTALPPKKIIFCQNCGCKLKVPDKKVKLHVVCPKCKADFYHKS